MVHTQNVRIIEGNQASVNRVMEAIQHFTRTTDLMVNLEKSSIFITGADDDTMNSLLEMTSFYLGSFPI